MTRKNNKTSAPLPVADYRHDDATRKNAPESGLAAQGSIPRLPQVVYRHNPHLPPQLRFDPSGQADRLPGLLLKATQQVLTPEEAQTLAQALRQHQPWLEWTTKHEQRTTRVNPVALHVHERLSAQAIVKLVEREQVQRSLFADPELAWNEAVKFYQHKVAWSNRLILGDSFEVMASLKSREDLAGQIQMIYIDPPYGIKFSSNFQPLIDKRDVGDKPEDLTRETETVRAYRDTWELGRHSYLRYLRDRILVARDLLSDSGSLFVQIGDENLHLIRSLLDECMGSNNHVSTISFKKTGGQDSGAIANVSDYIVWYAKDKSKVKFNRLYKTKEFGEGAGDRYKSVMTEYGLSLPISNFTDQSGDIELPASARLYLGAPMTSDGPPKEPWPIKFQDKVINHKSNQHWKTNSIGVSRLIEAERLMATKDSVNFILYIDDFAATSLSNLWTDTMGTADRGRRYVVQTTTKVIERCVLMSTDPGDIVLDPTCGSGTTAYVAEQWGRRWITVDTSRVALALARQRLLTATFPMYRTRDGGTNPHQNFVYKTIPHITLKSIAQNPHLDPVFEKYRPLLDASLATLNTALRAVSEDFRRALARKLAEFEKTNGKRMVTDAHRRRWILPKERWEHWEVPFDTDPDYPQALADAVLAYRKTWRAKMDEVNAVIAANAEAEDLVDQPEVVKGVVRVSGPFTVEGVNPLEGSLEEGLFGGAPEEEELPAFDPVIEAQNAEAYHDRMLRLLRTDGVRFQNNKVNRVLRVDFMKNEALHAEGEWLPDDAEEGTEPRRVAFSFGPEHGPVTSTQVERALRQANRRGFDDVVFAGFSFDAAAQAAIQEDPNPEVRCHLAHIRPDLSPSMNGLLKDSPGGQFFTVFGTPRAALRQQGGEYVVEMQGVDVYDPVNNTVSSTGSAKVAAWFLDADYDGRTFCVSQAFFPDRSAWEKIGRDLKGTIDPDVLEKLSGTTSLPFPSGKNGRAAVKVIDPRGNEVLALVNLEGMAAGVGA